MIPSQRIGLQLARKLSSVTAQTIIKKTHIAFADDEMYSSLIEHLEYIMNLELEKLFNEPITDNKSNTYWSWQLLPERTNLVHGYPAYSISLLFVKDFKPESLVVINVATGDEYTAANSQVAMHGNQRIRVDKTLSQKILYSGDVKLPGNIRENGSPLLSIVNLAQGGLNAVCYTNLNKFTIDIAKLLIQQAGGQCYDIEGNELSDNNSGTSLLAANNKLSRRLIAHLRKD